MSVKKSNFPTQNWNGLSDNPARTSRESDVDPSFDDYDEIAAELIKTQEYIVDEGVQFLEGATNTTLKDHINTVSSAGLISGGTVTDGGSETVNVSAGSGLIRKTDSPTGELVHFDWSAVTGIAIPTDTVRWVTVKFNGGLPIVTTAIDHENISHTNEFALAIIVNTGGTLHVHQSPDTIGDAISKIVDRLFETEPLARDIRLGGLLLSNTGTRNLILTSGAVWEKLNRQEIPAKDTSVSDTFDAFHKDSPSGFVKATSQTQWPNTKYDDGSGTLAILGPSKYGVLWFYIEIDGDLVMMYGVGEYSTATKAQEEIAPTNLPDQILHGGRLISRLIFQESAAIPDSITSAFAEI